jgi:CBS domain-containing protein
MRKKLLQQTIGESSQLHEELISEVNCQEKPSLPIGRLHKLVRVGEVMRKGAYCFEDQTMDEAREIMRAHHLRFLPVVDDKLRIIGTVEMPGTKRTAS